MLLKKKKEAKSENMAVKDIKISQKMKKGQLSIEKDNMKCKKITARSLNKVSASSCKSR